MKVGVEELLRGRVVPARTWESACSGLWPLQKRLMLRRQMAAAAGKKEYNLAVLDGLEVDEELSALATQYWAEGTWIGKWHHEQREA